VNIITEHCPEILGSPTGIHAFMADSCQYGNVITAQDIVLADFDRKTVTTGGGLFLFEQLDSKGEVVWRGCRRMIRAADGYRIDESGDGEWITVPSLESERIRIVAYVKEVYQPRSLSGRRASRGQA
jgi:hypothetical protein